jgi:hypothetical protein
MTFKEITITAHRNADAGLGMTVPYVITVTQDGKQICQLYQETAGDFMIQKRALTALAAAMGAVITERTLNGLKVDDI